MSYYTIFDEVEATLTASTTNATLASSDVTIVHNFGTGKKFQVPIGALAGGAGGQSVTYFTTLAFYSGSTVTSLGAYSTASSSAFVPSYGISAFRSTTGTSSVWVLNDPVTVGQTKTLMWDNTATSTGYFVQPVAATITSSASPTGVFVNLGPAGTMSPQGNVVTLTALSSTRWVVTSHTTNILFS